MSFEYISAEITNDLAELSDQEMVEYFEHLANWAEAQADAVRVHIRFLDFEAGLKDGRTQDDLEDLPDDLLDEPVVWFNYGR